MYCFTAADVVKRTTTMVPNDNLALQRVTAMVGVGICFASDDDADEGAV